MSEMIEKVARVIDPMAWAVPWEDYPAERARREARQAGSLMAAKRAIEAMREATDQMLEEGSIVRNPHEPRIVNTRSTWEAMIDEATK